MEDPKQIILLLSPKSIRRFSTVEAVQQFKIGRKRKAYRAQNQKRRKFFGDKINRETASLGLVYLSSTSSVGHVVIRLTAY
jgi:hypothetical protein